MYNAIEYNQGQFENIEEIVESMAEDIISAFSGCNTDEYESLFHRIFFNKLTEEDTIIFKNNWSANKSKNNIKYYWDTQPGISLETTFGNDIPALALVQIYLINVVMNKILADSSLIELTDNGPLTKARKQLELTLINPPKIKEFETFKSAYYNDYRSKWFSNPGSTMKRLLETQQITTMEQVEKYATANPHTRTAKIIKNLPTDQTDPSEFIAFKNLYYQTFYSKFFLFRNYWSTMKGLLENGTITTMEQVRNYAKQYPNTRTARIIRDLPINSAPKPNDNPLDNPYNDGIDP